MTTLRKIGILGGTFDPVHNGHLQLAEMMALDFHLDFIQFIPNNRPPHRPHPIANSQHRLEMLRIATARYPKFVVNDIETKREGPSYMIDTLKSLRQLLGQAPLCLIIGNDAFASFNEWQDWENIPNYAHLIVVNRPHAPLPKAPWAEAFLKKHQTQHRYDLTQTPAGKIFLQHINPIPISATDIRHKLATGMNVSQDLPTEVLSYIKMHQLYP